MSRSESINVDWYRRKEDFCGKTDMIDMRFLVDELVKCLYGNYNFIVQTSAQDSHLHYPSSLNIR